MPTVRARGAALRAALVEADQATTALPAIAVTAPAEHAAAWSTAQAGLTAAMDRVKRLVGLVRHWVLDAPKQMEAWLEHIVAMGTVDRPTAVYLKALREGGKVGPARRPAYQMKSMTLDGDFASADAGATYLRTTCTERARNRAGARATTMPEIFALQFFCNESGMRFTQEVAPFSVVPGAKDRIVLMGIDTNAHRKGSFDAVYHAGGDWYWSRGWGVGQATEANGTLDGVRLVRGLPVMPDDAAAVQHPRPYVDHEASVDDAMRRKILARYDRSARRDCSYGDVVATNRYDCRTCLRRFHDAGLTGKGEHGRGGVFVPMGKDSIGNPRKTTGFFVDLERLTPYARASADAPPEDAAEVALRYNRFFGKDPPASSEHVARVLGRMDGKLKLSAAIKAVAKESDLDAAALTAEVEAHLDARAQMPCSWLLVRIRYAGTGEQAFGALHSLLAVVGALDTDNATLKKHILEASKLRGGVE